MPLYICILIVGKIDDDEFKEEYGGNRKCGLEDGTGPFRSRGGHIFILDN